MDHGSTCITRLCTTSKSHWVYVYLLYTETMHISTHKGLQWGEIGVLGIPFNLLDFFQGEMFNFHVFRRSLVLISLERISSLAFVDISLLWHVNNSADHGINLSIGIYTYNWVFIMDNMWNIAKQFPIFKIVNLYE